MKKTLGILLFLIAVCVATGLAEPRFLGAGNVNNILKYSALVGFIGVGAALVIVTGGIDLSIGSVICLSGCLTGWLLAPGQDWNLTATLAAVAAASVAIGLLHGVLITKAGLQPFVVTLCGLLFYRGIARWFTGDDTVGIPRDLEGLRFLVKGRLPLDPGDLATWLRTLAGGEYPGDLSRGYELPLTMVLLAAVAVAASVLLNQTVFGRHLLALGRSPRAAEYSGIAGDRIVIACYVICSALTGLTGVLFAVEIGSVQPASFGNFYELYAIAAAVLGGCSLRGGEGSIFGVVIGAAVIRVLPNSVNLLGIPSKLEGAIIGAAILLSVLADETVRRLVARRRAARRG